MVISFRLVLLLIAFILLLLAGLNVMAPRVNLLALGLACWVLAGIVTV